MKLSNGADISILDDEYTYESDHLNVESTTLEEFVEDLRYYGVIDSFVVQSNGNEVFAIMGTDKGVPTPPKPSLNDAYDMVIEDIRNKEAQSDTQYDRQIQTLGILHIEQDAISD